MVISNPNNEQGILDQYQPLIDDLNKSIEEKNQQLKFFSDENKMPENIGICETSLDKTLNTLGVQRQAYHGKSFIGNHCHKMLQVYTSYKILFIYTLCSQRIQIFLYNTVVPTYVLWQRINIAFLRVLDEKSRAIIK